MADNVNLTSPAGTVAADDVGGALHQRVKVTWGPDGTGNDADVATGKPLPVQVRSATGLIPIGEPSDAAWTSGDGTLVSILKTVVSWTSRIYSATSPIAPATATATTSLMIGGQYDSTQKTLTNGQQASNALSARGAMIVNQGAETFTVTANAGTNLNTSALALETGGNLATTAATLGATTGAAVTTDATGTIQQYLRGLVTRWANALGAGTAAAALRTTQASDSPLVTAVGEVQASPTANTVLDRLKAINTSLTGGLTLSGTVGLAAGTAQVGLFTPNFTSSGIVTLQSNATGTTYNTFSSQACKQLTLINDTGVDLEIRQDGAGSTFILWAGAAFTYLGITNANQVGYRRKDTSNTQVTLAAKWEA